MNQFQKQFCGLSLGVLLAATVAACTAPTSQAPTTGNTSDTTESQSDTSATTSDSGATAQDTVTSTVAAGSEQGTGDTASDTNAATSAKANLNTATEKELLGAVPDLGERMVDEFMEYRPYTSIQQFRQEIGKYVDEAQVSNYEQYVYVPVNVNEADAATLMQIPGVDETAADGLIAARPFASNDAFLEQLTTVAPSVDHTAAESYLEVQ